MAPKEEEEAGRVRAHRRIAERSKGYQYDTAAPACVLTPVSARCWEPSQTAVCV